MKKLASIVVILACILFIVGAGYQTRSHWYGQIMNFFDERLDATWKTNLWRGCPLLAIQSNPEIGVIFFEDFEDFGDVTIADPPTLKGWTTAQNISGEIILTSEGIGGVLEMDCNSATAGQGLQVQKSNPAYKCADGKDLWFECEFKIVDTNATTQFFAGLATLDTNLMPAGDLNTVSDYIGFGMETGAAGVLSFYFCKDTAELSDEIGYVDEGVFHTVGFKVSGTNAINAYMDGVGVTLTNVVYTGIPTTDTLTPSFVCQEDGSSKDPILHIEWVKTVQLK